MQDGIDTPREPSTYQAAIEKTLQRGEALIDHLRLHGVPMIEEADRWRAFWSEWRELVRAGEGDRATWEDLWRRVHLLRRKIG
jgi:hypothetical protein